MGKPTGKLIDIIKPLGRGSDYFGPCEICGKHMSEAFSYRKSREWVREDGSLYYGSGSPTTYAHENCIHTKYSIK